MCAAPSAFVCIEINAIRNMELFLCCFKHTAIILHITVNTRECQLKPMCSSSLHVCVCVLREKERACGRACSSVIVYEYVHVCVCVCVCVCIYILCVCVSLWRV